MLNTFRTILFIGLFVLPFHAACQIIEVSGTVVDQDSGEPMPYANIQVAGGGLGTSTNSLGAFVLKIPDAYADGTVLVSFIGYQTKRLAIPTIQKRITVLLAPDRTNLPEIVVTPPNVLELVKQAFLKVPENYNLDPHVRTGFLRDRTLSDGKFVGFKEVLFEVYARGRKRRVGLLKGRYAEDKKLKSQVHHSTYNSIQPIWGNLPGEYLMLEIDRPKNKGIEDYYDFIWRKSININGEEVMVIDFDQKDGLRKSLLKGKLYIERSSLAFVAMDLNLSPKGKKFLKTNRGWNGGRSGRFPLKMMLKEQQIYLQYEKSEGKWYLKTATWNLSSEIRHQFFWYDGGTANLDYQSERVMTSTDFTNTPSQVDSLLEHSALSIHEMELKVGEENYEEAFWGAYNYLRSDLDFNQVAAKMNENNIAWEKEMKAKLLAEFARKKKSRSAKKFGEDLVYFKDMMEQTHPGLFWYTTEKQWNKMIEEAESYVRIIKEERDFDKLISALTAKIDCGHTDVLPAKSWEDYQNFYGKKLPLKLMFANGRAYTMGNPCAASEPVHIYELSTINKQSVPGLIQEFKNYISTDGANETYKEYVLQEEFANLYARYINTPESFEIDGVDQIDGTKFGCSINARVGGHEAVTPKESLYDYSIDNKRKLARLRIRSFEDDPLEETGFATFLNIFFQKLREKATEHLIIDLRNNRGGNGEFGALLFSYLTNAPFQYLERLSVATIDPRYLNRLTFEQVSLLEAVPDYLDNIRSEDDIFLYTDHRNLGTQEPSSFNYSGKIYVLINGGTYSTAAEFSAIVRSNKRAVFIGEESGGGYFGNSSFGTPVFELPNSKIRIQVPLAKLEMAVDDDHPKGKGVLPDYPVKYSIAEMGQQIDKEMAVALRLIDESLR